MSQLFKKLPRRTKFQASLVWFFAFYFLFSPLTPLAGIFFQKVRAASPLEVEIEIDTVNTGETLEVPIRLTNSSDFEWDEKIKLGLHWENAANQVVISDFENFTEFLVPVNPGEETDPEQKINMVVPKNINGEYVLKIDLYDEDNEEFLSNQGLVETYDAFVTVIDTIAPSGEILLDGGESEAQDESIELDFSRVEDNIGVASYKFSLVEEDLEGIEYVDFSEDLVEIEVPDATGDYTVYAKFRDTAGNESETISATIHYKKYNIVPVLETGVEDALLGGEMIYTVEVRNEGADDAYNALVEIVLPEGFSYIDSVIVESEFESDNPVSPSFVDTNEHNQQVLQFRSFADLPSGERKTFAIKLQVPGEEYNYKIGDLVTITSRAELFKRINWEEGYETDAVIEFELLPFVAKTKNVGEELIGEEQKQEIEVKNNAVQDSARSEDNPAIVRFELDNGMEYVEGSEVVENYQGLDEYVFNVVETVNGKVLEWIFGDGFKKENYESPLKILFNTLLGKNKEEDPVTGDLPIEHGETLENNLAVDAGYITGVVEDEEGNLVDVIGEFSTEEKQRVTAKYFDISKIASPHVIGIGEKVEYTIKIKVSEYYKLSGITVIDKLPDGLTFIEGSASVPEYLTSKNLGTGETEIIWRLLEIEAGGEYEIRYSATLEEDYSDGERVLSNDHLDNSVLIDAIWDDLEVVGRAGEATDMDRAVVRSSRPEFNLQAISTLNPSPSEDHNVRVGDRVEVTSQVVFPEDVPTKEFDYKIYFPVGTKLVEDSMTISHSLSSEKSANDFEQVTGGIAFDFGMVEPGGVWQISYTLEVQDDPNLKLATLTRNLFRADYQNTNADKFTYRDEITLNIIEPRIEVAKKILNGYLASGEHALIEVSIRNSGTADAWGLQVEDTLPKNSNLVSFEAGEIGYELTETGSGFEVTAETLAAGGEISYTYMIRGNEGLITGDDMGSFIRVGEFFNRSIFDGELRRAFESELYNFNWIASEPALATGLTRLPTELTVGDTIQIGRDDEVYLVATILNVGGAPAYNVRPKVDLRHVAGLVDDVNDVYFEVYVNGNLQPDTTAVVLDGVYEFVGFDLGPNDEIVIDFPGLKSKRFEEFGNEYTATVSAEADSALGQGIRKDTSAELTTDWDIDDMVSRKLVVTKLDNIPPVGFIYYKDPQTSEYIAFTNQDAVSLDYRAYDPLNDVYAKNEIIAVRFSDNAQDWFILDESLKCDEQTCGSFGQSSSETWQVWDGASLERQSVGLSNEGRNFHYFEVADLYGNTAVIENYVVKDTQAPKDGAVMITPDAEDFYDRRYTGSLENYLVFWAQDEDTGEEGELLDPTDYAGVGQFRYLVAGDVVSELDPESVEKEMGSWFDMTEGINSTTADWSAFEFEDGDLLHVYMQFRDLAGNESESIYHDDIIYTSVAPEVSINLNDGDEYTNYSLVDLGLQIEDSISGVYEIRFTETEESFGEWILYTDEITQYILPESWQTGEKELCAQVRDHAGNLSNVACDSIILDTTAPDGSVMINNGDEQSDSVEVVLGLDASDQVLDDGTLGAGGIEFSYSLDGANWSEYEALVSQKQVTLPNPIGENTVYVKFRDLLGNESERVSDSILINPFSGTGNIVINDNALFTNTNLVNLDLSSSGEPVLMRFFEHTGDDTVSFVPPAPPEVSTPPQQATDVNACGAGDEWTYWYEYRAERDCYLEDEFGKKDVFVQYLYANGETSPIYNDGIIYAPYYGVEYLQDELWELNNGDDRTYGLGKIPGVVLSQDDFTLRFSAKNTGSMTWQKYSDHPVHVTYRWIPIENEYDFEDDMPGGGNRAVMGGDVAWNQETGELELFVDTPVFPGRYNLVVDTIHEGVTWFSVYANQTIEQEVIVQQNPQKETPELEEVLGIYDLPPNAGGWRDERYDHSCDEKYGNWSIGDQCYLSGTIYPADSPYNAKIVTDTGKVYNLNSSKLPPFYYKDAKINVEYTRISGNIGYFKITGGPWEIEKTWIARLHWKNDLGTLVDLKRGEEKTLQFSYHNIGTGTWNRSDTFAFSSYGNFTYVGVDPLNIPFQAGTYAVGPGSVGLFSVPIRVPETLGNGVYNHCFAIKNTLHQMSYDAEACFRIRITNTEAEEREYLCSLPQNVYDGIDGNVIGQVSSGDHVIMMETQGDWTRVYFEENYDAWIENNLGCFSDATIIEHPIKSTVLPVIDPPTGDMGRIIAVDCIDMRLGPSVNFPVIDRLPYGEEVRVLQETVQRDNYMGWLYIERTNGSRGWIPKGYVAHVNDPADVTIDLAPPYYSAHACGGSKTVYAGPGTQYPVKGTIATNTNMTIVHKWDSGNDTWYYVIYSYSGNAGWINASGNVCRGSYTPPKSYSGNVGGKSIYNDVVYYPPVDNRVVTSPFGPRLFGFHDGADYVSKDGACGQPIKAAAPGTISKVVSGYGPGKYSSDPVLGLVYYFFYKDRANYVYIDHDNGTRTAYVHLDDVYVKEGQRVKAGEVIGTMGTSGWSSGCHLHFEFWTDKNTESSAIDPESVLNQKISIADLSILAFRDKYLRDISGEQGITDWCGYRTKYISSSRLTNGTSAAWGAKLIYNPAIGRTILVKNGILDKYNEMNGPCSVLGPPILTSGRPTVASAWQNNYYADVVAADSKYGTGGWVQRFENGSIYFNDKNWSGYAVYGELGEKYETLEPSGTASSWGFPMSDQFMDNGRICQMFEIGKKCAGTKDTAVRDEIYPPGILVGIEENEVEIEPDFTDKVIEAIESFKEDQSNANVFEEIEAYAYLFYGALKGAGKSVVDLVKFVYNLAMHFPTEWNNIKDALKTLYYEPEVVKYLLYDKLDEFIEKDLNGKFEMYGEIIGPVILDILLLLMAGLGVAKYAGDLARKIRNIKVIAKTLAFADKVVSIVVNGVKLVVKFTKDGLVRIGELAKSFAALTVEQVKRVLRALNLLPEEKAYLWIEKIGGRVKPMNIQNSKLRSIVDELYRADAVVGGGGSADALIYEKVTGKFLSKIGHAQKVGDRLAELKKLVQSGVLFGDDLVNAQNLIDDLQRALDFTP